MPPELVLVLPEPPSLNRMIELAKKRTRRSRDGGWMKRSLPVVYDQELELYSLQCTRTLRLAKISPPERPWARWEIVSAEFRLHGQRDEIELMAGLKWPVDHLVRAGFVDDDSPLELINIPRPVQVIDRKNRGITLVIRQATP